MSAACEPDPTPAVTLRRPKSEEIPKTGDNPPEGSEEWCSDDLQIAIEAGRAKVNRWRAIATGRGQIWNRSCHIDNIGAIWGLQLVAHSNPPCPI